MIFTIFSLFLKYRALNFIEGSYNNICYEFEAEVFKNENGIRRINYIEKYGFNSEKINDKNFQNKITDDFFYKIYGSQFKIKNNYLCIELCFNKEEIYDKDLGIILKEIILNYFEKLKDAENNKELIELSELHIYNLDLKRIIASSFERLNCDKNLIVHHAYLKTDILKESGQNLDFFKNIKQLYGDDSFPNEPSILIFHDLPDVFGFTDRKEMFIYDKIDEYDIRYSVSSITFYPGSKNTCKSIHEIRREYVQDSVYESIQIGLVHELGLVKSVDANGPYFVVFDKTWIFEIKEPRYYGRIYFNIANFELYFNIFVNRRSQEEQNFINVSLKMEIEKNDSDKVILDLLYRNGSEVIYSEEKEINDIRILNLYNIDFYSTPQYKILKNFCENTVKMIENMKKSRDINITEFLNQIML